MTIWKAGTLSLPAAIMLLFGVVGFALVPGFIILAQYQKYVLSVQVQLAFSSILVFAVKLVLSTIFMIASIAVYADTVFPLVMSSFAFIFERIEMTD